jgi:putative FmdB family regulatory protein
MPIYEYHCLKCGKDFEALVFKNEEVSCPACGSKELQKKFSVFATQGLEKNVGSQSCGSCKATSCENCK